MADDVINDANIPETADDGSPLGTLRVGGRVYAKNRMGELEAVAASEQRRSDLADLTGEADADEGILDLYEGFSDGEKRRVALVRYVKDGLSAADVASELKVPEKTVLMWAYHGKWNRVASRELQVRAEEESRALANLRLKHRETLLRKQVEDSSEIQRRIMDKVKDDSISMKTAAESLAALAKVQNSAMGVADSGAITTGSEEHGTGKGGTVNNTVVFMGGSLPTARKAREDTIDVETV